MVDSEEAKGGIVYVEAEELKGNVLKLKQEGGLKASWMGKMDKGAEVEVVNAVVRGAPGGRGDKRLPSNIPRSSERQWFIPPSQSNPASPPPPPPPNVPKSARGETTPNCKSLSGSKTVPGLGPAERGGG